MRGEQDKLEIKLEHYNLDNKHRFILVVISKLFKKMLKR